MRGVYIKTISFLGPKGTFTHQVADMLNDDLISFNTIPEVMESVSNNETSFGVVPIENSIEGPVGITLDSLAHNFDLKIFKEIIVPINQNFIVNRNAKLEDIKDIYSHFQAISQCNGFLSKLNIPTHYTDSTAQAVKKIIGDKSKAAIGNVKAAEIYNLKILKENIQDTNNNETRFVVISNTDHKLTGRDKTSIIFSIYEDEPGGLYNILGIFEKYNINLTKIESRPSKKGLGKYMFFVDFKGHRCDSTIQKILFEINENTYFFKVLGSYPEF